MPTQNEATQKIRSFNRFYTRLLGLLDRHILDSDFSMTEARVLLEISKENGTTARKLTERLKIDPSYMSRMLRGFEARSLITQTPSPTDSRSKLITSTAEGLLALERLSARSDAQVRSLTAALSPEDLQSVLDAMALIRNQFSRAVFPAVIRNYQPGDEEYIIQRHRELYLNEYGLNEAFAGYVHKTVHQLTDHLDPNTECVLIAEGNGRPIGSIAIAKRDSQTAQLRYFLLEPEARGQGLGLRLIEEALSFCRQTGYKRVFLETINLLTTARSLYSRMGFQIYQTRVQSDWGREVTEEYWELIL